MPRTLEELRLMVESACAARGFDVVAMEMGWKEPTVRAFVSRRIAQPRAERWRRLLDWAARTDAATAELARDRQSPALPYSASSGALPHLSEYWRGVLYATQRMAATTAALLDEMTRATGGAGPSAPPLPAEGLTRLDVDAGAGEGPAGRAGRAGRRRA